MKKTTGYAPTQAVVVGVFRTWHDVNELRVMHFRIKTCREVRCMVQLSLEIAGVIHLGDGQVINVIYHPRELSRQSGRVPVVLSVLVILSVA